MPDLRTTIKEKLTAFSSSELRPASLNLLATLGYESDKTLHIKNASPEAFLEIIPTDKRELFSKDKALFKDWTSADLLFQLTDEELSTEQSLFEDTQVNKSLLKSYLFFAIELNGEDAKNGQYARGKLTQIARQINRVFPMPVMVLIKHPDQSRTVVSIAVINRRKNKRDAHKDVLGKVTIIRDISLTDPHRGHLDILSSFVFSNLTHPQKLPITNFDTLHTAWEEIFNVELLNKRFYKELANWYFWAMKHCHFPLLDETADKYHLFKDRTKVREHEAKNLIRLLTRTLFVWFIKERGLVSDSLFQPVELKQKILTAFNEESEKTNYYKAVLQNLFFATLNQTHGEREFRKSGQHQNSTSLLRYKDRLKSPADFISSLEATTPFLNGGLFECLDHPHATKTGPQGGKIIVYEDGFSDRKDNPLHMPDFLFFGAERKDDLSGDHAYGESKYQNETVRGLIHILNRYKFTVVENTPIDQEIALDPELLGQVFENLLASYNPETKTTARKQTGSFYTPRPIVDYMVDESLKAHLSKALSSKGGMSIEDANASLDLLFEYRDADHELYEPHQIETIITAIDSCKILDPACGSGAFPMGILQKLVYILSKIDPDNKRWKQTQLDKLDSSPMREALEEDFENNDDDYGRKLYLIENCLYGVDIQSIATQVSKLRFFISLIVDQNINKKEENFGVRPLPNLETKFVTANTLIQLEKPSTQGELADISTVAQLQKELKRVRHALFTAKTPKTKNKYREQDKLLREQIAAELKNNGWGSNSAAALARWDPYDQNASEDYFDPEWMFGEKEFDIVIGNPPYIQIQKFPAKQKAIWQKQGYQTYAATADIYCLFYERGGQLLRNGGILCYITSNKWMRAGYGAKLRDYFSSSVCVNEILDFWGILVFKAATVDTNILRFSKDRAVAQCNSVSIPKEFNFSVTLKEYMSIHAVPFTLPSSSKENWAVLSKARRRIKILVEEQGVPLNEWNLYINRGVLTGYNEAFYLTTKERDAMIAEDPDCKELIAPLLRGRFVDRYATSWDKAWMIATFPALKLTINDIPKPIINHLSDYLPKLKQAGETFINKEGKTDKTRKKTENQWFETQDSISYYKQFKKTKIIYPEITKWLGFYYDTEDNFVPNNKAFIITSQGDSLAYLTAFFNSHLFRCCFKDNFPTQGEDRRELRGIFFKLLRVKKPTKNEVTLYEKLVPLVQLAKRKETHNPAQFLEDLIDACIMESYFHDHMAERDLLFIDYLLPHLKSYDPNVEDYQQMKFLISFYKNFHTLTTKHPIRNRLNRITTDSPDLLDTIKQEGKV